MMSRENVTMLMLNFTHPLTKDQHAQIEALANTSIESVRTIPVQINQDEPLEPQITAIVDAVGLSSSSTHPATRQPPSSYLPNSTAASATSHHSYAFAPWLVVHQLSTKS